MKKSPLRGMVYLVGAGPGDPSLITVKGKACLERADVVLYDYLANPRLLSHCSAKTKIIYAGKKGSTHAEAQEKLNRQLVRFALQGKVIVRLKGGDPFVFGRGGEEALRLKEAGIPFEIVPGVTSAIAVPAYAGIPVTHRDFNSSFAVVTGHQKEGEEHREPDWSALARMETLVILMGVSHLSEIVKNLIREGKSSTTPIAVLAWGTYPYQKKVIGQLKTIVTLVAESGIQHPAVIVVGDVVSLSSSLSWFETKPLFGRRFIVTRSESQASSLVQGLEEQGGQVLEWPCHEFFPVAIKPQAWRSFAKYDYLLFTSTQAVKFFFKEYLKKYPDIRELKGISIVSIGPATTEALRDFGLVADIESRRNDSEGIVLGINPKIIKNKSILWPRAKVVRDVLEKGLRASGAKVDSLIVYESRVPKRSSQDKERLRDFIAHGVDLVTLTSSLAAERFQESLTSMKVKRSLPVASLGPITSQRAQELGFDVKVQSSKPLIANLLEEVRSYCQDLGQTKNKKFGRL